MVAAIRRMARIASSLAGDDVVNFVRVTVGVHDGDNGDVQLAGLRDGVALLARSQPRTARRAASSCPLTPPRYFSSLAISPRCFMTSFLGSMCERAVRLHLLQLGQTVDTGAHGAGSSSACRPASGRSRSAWPTRAGLFLDSESLCLLLGAHEQDGLAVGSQVADEGRIGLFQLLHRLLQGR